MSVATPTGTGRSQPMQALELANATRIANAKLRREVRALGAKRGALRVAHALEWEHDDPQTGSLRIGHFLCAVQYLHEVKVTRCLAAANVRFSDKKVRDLTKRQREAIAIQLRMWSEMRP